jgi:hypothetical protein
MAGTEHQQALRLWSLATFHTASFVAAVVIGVHVKGSLGGALGLLNTSVGVAAFLALWAITWCATRKGLYGMDPRIEDASLPTIVASTTVAGGWNGVGIFALILSLSVVSILAGNRAGGLALIPALFFVVVIGSLLAFTIGAVVGFAYGVLDALLLRAGAALFRWASISA